MKFPQLCAFLLLFASPAFAAKRFQLHREYEVKNLSPDKELKIKLTLAGLAPYLNSTIVSAAYQPQPTSVSDPHMGVQKLAYDLSVPAGQTMAVTMTWVIELNSTSEGVAETIDAATLSLYKNPGNLIESAHPEIIAVAKQLRVEATDDHAFAAAIYHKVKKHMKPQGYGSDNKGALFALRKGTGDCTEYASLIIALARAGGLPARMNNVMSMAKDGTAHYDNHNNAEIYLDGRWFTAEAFFGINTFGKIADTEVVTRIGLKNKPITWASWSTPASMKRFKDVKLKGHSWQRLP